MGVQAQNLLAPCMALCHGGAKNNRKRSCEFCHVNYVSAYTRSRTNTLSSRREPRRARSRPLDPGRTFWRQRAHSLGLFREVRPDGVTCTTLLVPSALPVRSASHARCGRACLALHAHLSLLACRAGRAAPIAAHAAITPGAMRGAPAVTARLP